MYLQLHRSHTIFIFEIISVGLSTMASCSSPNPEVAPRTSGNQYVFPSEADPHEATILGFPSQNSLSPSEIGLFRSELIEIASVISQFEPVRFYARPEDTNTVNAMLEARSPNSANITIIPFPIVHAWVRDTGPSYVFKSSPNSEHNSGRNGASRFAVDFNFSEWGGKTSVPGEEEDTPVLSPDELHDNKMFSRRLIEKDDLPSNVTRVETILSLEGGGIEVDGNGTLLITESAVVNRNRNPGLSKTQIFEELKRLFGVSKVISIPGIRNRDITDCHIDAVARFIRPGVAVVSMPHRNQGKEWVRVANQAIQVLRKEPGAGGRRFEVHVVDEPDPWSLVGGDDEMSLSYVNYYLVNGGVVIPGFGDQRLDAKALDQFEKLFPEREVVQVEIRGIALAGGGIHCVTQQVPKCDIEL